MELMNAGRAPADSRTAEIIKRWSGAGTTAIDAGHSVSYLRRSGQVRDRDFEVSHVDDLDLPCAIEGNEVCGKSPLRAQPGTGPSSPVWSLG